MCIRNDSGYIESTNLVADKLRLSTDDGLWRSELLGIQVSTRVGLFVMRLVWQVSVRYPG